MTGGGLSMMGLNPLSVSLLATHKQDLMFIVHVETRPSRDPWQPHRPFVPPAGSDSGVTAELPQLPSVFNCRTS